MPARPRASSRPIQGDPLRVGGVTASWGGCRLGGLWRVQGARRVTARALDLRLYLTHSEGC